MKGIFYYGLLAMSFLAFTSMVKADDTYIGIDFSSAKVDLPRTSGTVGMIRGRFGVVVLPDSYSKFGFESHMAFGLSDTSVTRNVAGSTFSEDATLELESVLGLYMRAEFFSAGIVGVYGLVGYAAAQTGPAFQARNSDGTAAFETELDPDENIVTTTTPITNEDSSTGVSFGVGMTFFVGKSISIQVETLQVHKSNNPLDFDVNSMSVGINIEL